MPFKKKKSARGGARPNTGPKKTHGPNMTLKVELFAYRWLLEEAFKRGVTLYALCAELLTEAAQKGAAFPDVPVKALDRDLKP